MFSVFHDLVEVSCDSVVAKSLRHNINEQCTETVNPGNFKTSSRGGGGILYKKQWLITLHLSFLCLFSQLFLVQCVALSCKLDNINSTSSCNYFYQQVILISKG